MNESHPAPFTTERGTTMSDTITPKALAEELGVNAKSLRGYLRKHYTRPVEAKNTTWLIAPDAADAAREHFAKQRTDATEPEVEAEA
jgi:hypothetical protein